MTTIPKEPSDEVSYFITKADEMAGYGLVTFTKIGDDLKHLLCVAIRDGWSREAILKIVDEAIVEEVHNE